MQGPLKKMPAVLNEHQTAQYQLALGDRKIELNELVGNELYLNFSGNIFCTHCGKKTKKSYSQGHCFVCMRKLASCDMCILKPETCHFARGTCREPKWGEANCFVDHYVYLSNTSGVKVGITRHTQLPTRWIDQGATQALPVFKVKSRLISGLLETALAKFVTDKTQWQAMLKGNNENLDLHLLAQELCDKVQPTLDSLNAEYGDDSWLRVDQQPVTINYPVQRFPTKVKSFNLDKTPQIGGILEGIKGQYLIFDTGVINVRKYGSYEVSVSL